MHILADDALRHKFAMFFKSVLSDNWVTNIFMETSHSFYKFIYQQIECHPHLQQIELRELCNKHGIQFQAYSSLGTMSTEKPVTFPHYKRVSM